MKPDSILQQNNTYYVLSWSVLYFTSYKYTLSRAVADVANVAGIAVSKCTSMAEAQLISCRASPKSQRRLLPFAALNEKDRQKENDTKLVAVWSSPNQ